MPPLTRRHGTRACRDGVGGCTRPECIQAAKDYQHAYWLERKKFMRRNSWVDPTGTRRRIQALAALGHTSQEISEASGVANSQVMKIARGVNGSAGEPKIAQSTVRRIQDAYERLSMSPGASPIAKARALAKGWVPPLAWEDELIDEPDATPYGVRVSDSTTLDLEEWAYIVRCGEDPERAAERCGVTIAAVERMAHRHGRTDLGSIAAAARNRRRVA